MIPDELRQQVRKHNTRQIAIGVATLAAAPLLWLFSFRLFQVLFYLASRWALGNKAEEVSFWMAVVGIVFLVIEGLREGWNLISLADLAERAPVGLLAPAGPALFGDVHRYSYMFSHVLFFAPRVTLTGVQALRSLIRPGPFTIDLATNVYNDLIRQDQWVPIAHYPGAVTAATLLKQLGLIWIEEDEGPKRLRVPPGGTQVG